MNEKETEDLLLRDLLYNCVSKVNLECEDIIAIDSNTLEFLTGKDLVKREKERDTNGIYQIPKD